MEIKKIGVMSIARISMLFGILYGIISGIFSAVAYANIGSITEEINSQVPAIISYLGYWSLIVMPILNGLFYFVAGALIALVYNLIANWIGGIKLETK
jgi:hypothetical protein